MGLLQRFTKLQKKINKYKMIKIHKKMKQNIKYNKIKETKLISKANLHALKIHGS